MATPYAAATADGELLEWLAGGVTQVLLDSTQTEGRLAMFRSAAPAGAASPAHVHTWEDEILVLLRGSATLWVGDRRHELGTGAVAFLPHGVPHAYRITAESDLLLLTTPGGLENFVHDAGAADNGQIILGPPSCPDDFLPDYPGALDLPPYVAGGDQHETLEWFDGALVRILLDQKRTGGRFSMGRSTFPAGSASPVYVHGKEDEAIVLLRGSAIYWVGEHRYDVSAGDVVLVPRGVSTAHRMTADTEILVVTTPGGLEELFRQAGRDVSQPRPDGWRISFDTLVRAAAATGQTILAAPLQADEAISARLVAA
jgi:quercetin dioxygenase-like cupin family protein